MFDIRRVALVLLTSACTPAASSSQPAATPTATPAATPPAPAETCLLGTYRVDVQQRMIQDDSESTRLEDQRIGEVPVLFAAQRAAIRGRTGPGPGREQSPVPNAPQTLLLLVGAQVTETLEDLEYVARPGGAKPTETRTTSKPYTFFLADAAWDCEAAAAELQAAPQGQIGAAACVPAAVRARCTPVDFAAR